MERGYAVIRTDIARRPLLSAREPLLWEGDMHDAERQRRAGQCEARDARASLNLARGEVARVESENLQLLAQNDGLRTLLAAERARRYNARMVR